MYYSNSPREVLGEIKKYMFINDISQDELARKMNKSKQSVSIIFKTGNPTLETLFCMLDALNLELEYSFEEKKEEHYNESLELKC